MNEDKMVLSEYARLRTINWLNGMQSSGAFDGFDEEVEDEQELILERQRILRSEQDSNTLFCQICSILRHCFFNRNFSN